MPDSLGAGIPGVGAVQNDSREFKSHRYRHRKPLVIRGFSPFPDKFWCKRGAVLEAVLPVKPQG